MIISVMHRVVFAITILLVCGACFAADIVPVKIQVDVENVQSRIPPEFIGFGYETSALAQADFFSTKNQQMLNLYRNLSPRGLIRIGGIISDHTSYTPDGICAARSQKQTTVINRASLQNLGEFARAAGWRVMWGLNLGTGSVVQAVSEAVDVNAELGDQLQSFEIGNEVDGLARFKKSYDAYRAAYLEYKSAIRSKLPGAFFSGPDGYGPLDWVRRFSKTESNDIKLFTLHYYIGGAGDPDTSIDKMLARNIGLEARLAELQQLSNDTHVPFRINESNSFFNGGKPEVSDTFASALWCLDYLYQLASYSSAGVNIETDINQHGWVSHYSPIVRNAYRAWTARPEYYGLLAFSLAGKGELLKTHLDHGNINLTGYATRDPAGACWITIINKDLNHDAAIEISLPPGYTSPQLFRLIAPSIDSKENVTLANAKVATDGTWMCGEGEKIELKQPNAANLLVPHASAAVVRCLQK